MLLFLAGGTAVAQEIAPASESGEEDASTESAQSAPVPSGDSGDSRVEAQQEAQQKEIEQLRADLEDLRARMDEEDEIDFDEMGASSEFEPSLDVYGFMAFYAGKWFIQEEDVMYGIMQNKFTFGITDLNIYFSGHLTETISSLVELRFTFLPNGADASFIPSYERVDNTYMDNSTSEELTLGGVIIERAKMTWQPYDFFGVSAGRFLTPFGIWNIDHGAPVVIPINKPYLMLRHTLPLNQTGLVVHGRFFPAASTYFDYAVTLSNGRGPTEEIYDLDDNKAVGLRLRLSYEGQDVGFAVGAYGFFGHTTDVTKAPGFAGEDGTTLTIVEEITERYQELAGSADILFRLWNFRLQSEVAGGYLKYRVRPLVVLPIVNVESPSGEYQPDFLRYSLYVLAAYEIPIVSGDDAMSLTPFVMVEYDVMYDSLPEYDTWIYRGGLNFRPNSFVVLKAACSYVRLPDAPNIADIWTLAGQVALTF